MSDRVEVPEGWVHVGWMLGPKLAAEHKITPLDDDYLTTLEMGEDEGGLRPEFVSRVVPIFARQEDIDRAD